MGGRRVDVANNGLFTFAGINDGGRKGNFPAM